ncbi:MAG TPA: hypothetical protein VEJ63_18295 [Planctomycetota bacterium]|nr:hypothetical protein [Planctomycetota bacterium]
MKTAILAACLIVTPMTLMAAANPGGGAANPGGGGGAGGPLELKLREVPTLDAAFLKTADLTLTESQSTKVAEAQKKIEDRRNELLQGQLKSQVALLAAQKSRKKADEKTAAENIAAVDKAIKNFKPEEDFDRALRQILTAEQFKKAQEAKKAAKK